jgi:5-methylcytosine-specific restriction endonuclease McrA
MPNECIYCGSTTDLSYDHLMARNRAGPDIADNVVMACKRCNSSKGDKGVDEGFEITISRN